MKVMMTEVLLIATLISANWNSSIYDIGMINSFIPSTVFRPSGLLAMKRMNSLLLRKMKPDIRRRKTMRAKSERFISVRFHLDIKH